MTRNERACLLRKLKPLNWYYFCQMEALNFGKDSPVTKQELQEQLMLSEASLNKHLEVWRSHRMIRRERGGYIVVQFDGEVSRISADPVKRIFKNSREIVAYWCDLYEEHYGTAYVINNWAVVTKQVGKLLIYPDEEIKAVLEVIIALYDTTWANQKYPRPTLGQTCSWLFVQAQPYAVKENPGSSESSSNLLEDIEAKGWF